MQSASSRRAFSFLASKIHPQLPLSPRESQQLLSLLTTSFRAHLDREHPIAPPDSGSSSSSRKQQSLQLVPSHASSNALSTRAKSSQTSASQHIESILANPLFAVKPRRRGSEPATVDAQTVLRDPLSWFLDQVAIGAADLSKASACLHILQNSARTGVAAARSGRKGPSIQIAEWLKYSGLDTSRAFIEFDFGKLVRPLVQMLLQEGEDAPIWRWFAYDPQTRINETGLGDVKIRDFRAQLLRVMVSTKAETLPCIDEALRTFLRAYNMGLEYGVGRKILQGAGFSLVMRILANPESVSSAELYESFLRSSKDWTVWSRGIESVLWLHHPTSPSALPGIACIRDPKGVADRISRAKGNSRRLLVHLCLGTARQSLAEQKYADAQFALEFTRDNFPDLVEPVPKASNKELEAIDQKQREEDKNLEMLGRLLPI